MQQIMEGLFSIMIVCGCFGSGVKQAAAAVDLQVVLRSQPSTSDERVTLPVTESVLLGGHTYFAEIWAQTDKSTGIFEVSFDATLNPNVLRVQRVTHTALFDVLQIGKIDNTTGVLNDVISRRDFPSYTDNRPVGFKKWIRVAVLEIAGRSTGTSVLTLREAKNHNFVTKEYGYVEPAVVSYSMLNMTVQCDVSDDGCDGIDNDCNGVIDDGFVIHPTTCGIGACHATGEVRCINGITSDSCMPGYPAVADKDCNGIDNDCNGIVDDGFVPQSTLCGFLASGAVKGMVTCESGELYVSCPSEEPKLWHGLLDTRPN